MPKARNASLGTSEKVTVAIGSTSSYMRWTLACGCGIGRTPPVVAAAPSWAASHPNYEQRGPAPTTPVDINPAKISLTFLPRTARLSCLARSAGQRSAGTWSHWGPGHTGDLITLREQVVQEL